MIDTKSISFKQNSREELLPEFSPDFPYTGSKAYLNEYDVPWHWHKAVELFYVESGALNYHTPNGTMHFPQGSGGLVNSGILHASTPKSDNTIQLLHLFDPSFLGGYAGSRIEHKYIAPIVTSPSLEILPLYPDDPGSPEILRDIQRSFTLSPRDFGYELRLRDLLSQIWLSLLTLPHPTQAKEIISDDKIKVMLIFIHDHFSDKLTIADIAAAAFVSERECYRLFRRILHTTPLDYLRDYRLQAARQLLAESSESVTAIAQRCGFGSSSAFGKLFREKFGATPAEYRRSRQNFDR